MSKTLIVSLMSILFIGMAGFGTYHFLEVKDKNQQLSEKDEDIRKLHLSVRSKQKEIAVLRKANAIFEVRIVELQDSIGRCQQTIYQLKSLLKKRTIEQVRIKEEMDNTREKYFVVEDHIVNLEQTKIEDTQTIEYLEAQKETLRIKNDSLYRANIIKEKELQSTQEDLLRAEMEKIKAQKVEQVIKQTAVNYDYIAIRRTPEGKDYSRVKRSQKAWNYTILDFTIRHPSRNLLVDETFVVKIIDLDSGNTLSHIESNPAFPNSHFDSKDLAFQFDGKKMNIVFHNNEEKRGENYAVQLYYRIDGVDHPLANGLKKFITNKRVTTLSL